MESSGIRSNWKLLLVLGALLLIVLLLIIFSIKPNNDKIISPTTYAPESSKPASKNSTSGTKIYRNSDISIVYPSSLTTVIRPVAGGGRSILFNGDKEGAFTLELQIIPNTNASVEEIAKVFKSFGYAESKVTLDKYPARQFIGSIKMPAPKQEEVVVAENLNQIFMLQLTYNNKSRVKEYDDLFLQIVNGFKFSK